METIRSFIGIDLSDEVKSRFSDIQTDFKKIRGLQSVKYVNPNIIHITLKFLGNITLSEVSNISQDLKIIKFRPFEIQFKGLGVFPSKKRIRIIWVGIDDAGNLANLYDLISSKLPDRFSEDRLFKPHITLARVKRFNPLEMSLLSEKVEELSKIDAGTFKVNAFQLKRSTLTPKGPLYETIEDVEL
jgi:2'-5' RNA ligase